MREDLIDFDRYIIKEDGTIYSKWYNKELGSNCSTGYKRVNLTCIDGKKRDFLIHRIIAYLFIPNPEKKPEVDHIDGNKKNNVYTNLRYVSHLDNMRNPNTEPQRFEAIRKKQGIPVIAFLNGKRVGKYSCLMEAARDLGLSCSHIAKHLKGYFTHVKGYKFERVC